MKRRVATTTGGPTSTASTAVPFEAAPASAPSSGGLPASGAAAKTLAGSPLPAIGKVRCLALVIMTLLAVGGWHVRAPSPSKMMMPPLENPTASGFTDAATSSLLRSIVAHGGPASSSSSSTSYSSSSSSTSTKNNIKRSLAWQHSLGYFPQVEDTSPENAWIFTQGDWMNETAWSWLQQQSREKFSQLYGTTGLKVPDPVVPDRKADWLNQHVQPFFSCPKITPVGQGDGTKLMCDPWRLLYPAARSDQSTTTASSIKNTNNHTSCLVYSIGSNGNFGFEDHLQQLLKEERTKRRRQARRPAPLEPGTTLLEEQQPAADDPEEEDRSNPCEIHTFDPEPRFARQGDPEQRGIHFHPWGVKSSYNDCQPRHYEETQVFFSLPEIMHKLGHTGRRIDVFKIDCEGCEWSTAADWLHPDLELGHILIETHDLPPLQGNLRDLCNSTTMHRMTADQFWNQFWSLGYVLYSRERNDWPGIFPYRTVYEWSMLKMDPEFLGADLLQQLHLPPVSSSDTTTRSSSSSSSSQGMGETLATSNERGS